VRTKGDFLKGRAVEQNNGFSLLVWRVLEEEEVTIVAEAADYFRPWWGLNGLSVGADRHFAVIADTDTGLLAPDVRPPRAVGSGTQDGAFFYQGLFASGFRRGAQFAVDFMLVGMGQGFFHERIGRFHVGDFVRGEQSGKAALEVLVAAFDFAFGLRGRGIAQGDAVEVQGSAQLGEGFGMSKEKGVIVHIKRQWQAVGTKVPVQEVQMRQQCFAVIEPGTHIVARGVIQQIQQCLFMF